MGITRTKPLQISAASSEDRQQLANLIHFGVHVHRHLDWRPPLDWIGRQPFLTASKNGEILGALACPPDPPNVAWIRLFAAVYSDSIDQLWSELWEACARQLQEYTGPLRVAAIPLQSWFQRLLESSQFFCNHHVVVLVWERGELPATSQDHSAVIRPMVLDDIPRVEKIDASAFGGVWQNSHSCLEIAFRQSAVATIAEQDGISVGYQISTATQMGGHLARLAVLPQYQGHGIGYSLVSDMLSQFYRRGARSVTVNTQHDNQDSLSLYQKAGFRLTGEEYPVFEYRSGI